MARKVQRVRTMHFSATVRGMRRYATLYMRKRDADLDTAELTLMNTRAAYEHFYRGAEYADYEAELKDRKLIIPRNPILITEGKPKK